MSASVLLGRVLSSQFDVFGTSTYDPLVCGVAGVALALPALAACTVRARRAAAVAPTDVMR